MAIRLLIGFWILMLGMTGHDTHTLTSDWKQVVGGWMRRMCG